MLWVILSSVSFVITIFTESYSKPCALWIDTAYATWNGTTVELLSSSSSSVLRCLLTVNEIIDFPASDSPISSKSYSQASISLIDSSSSISNWISCSPGWISKIFPLELLWINGEKMFDGVNTLIHLLLVYCQRLYRGTDQASHKSLLIERGL